MDNKNEEISVLEEMSVFLTTVLKYMMKSTLSIFGAVWKVKISLLHFFRPTQKQ